MAKKPVVFEDRKFNIKVEYTQYIRNYLNPLGVAELPKIKDEEMSFFKEIASKTNPDDMSEGSKIKIIRREGAESNTIVVNPNGKVKSLHWRMITKRELKKAVNEEETNNESEINKNQGSKNDICV